MLPNRRIPQVYQRLPPTPPSWIHRVEFSHLHDASVEACLPHELGQCLASLPCIQLELVEPIPKNGGVLSPFRNQVEIEMFENLWNPITAVFLGGGGIGGGPLDPHDVFIYGNVPYDPLGINRNGGSSSRTNFPSRHGKLSGGRVRSSPVIHSLTITLEFLRKSASSHRHKGQS